ncbi:ATP-dependent DNA helicase DinG [Bacillus lacus]|uniref:3'-5' exonuclease DinG n=1 Tax=Metabacillus lacus TaxID=1983721 RepID=A0A7X2IW97_9BACI|nr:ATP-dependent DNA helicase DinG [Metabacillus lacus]MRX70967.1 ATP-dependent DNA helicase DinG [Metabacillus lacus]
MKKQRFVVVDVETTGNSPKKGDRIIQIAAVVVENQKIVDTFSSFINPYTEIPLFIEQLTGITQQMVEDAPPFKEVAKTISEMLEDAYFVAHNVYFDLAFIQEELQQSGMPRFQGGLIDTVELARIAYPQSSSYKLTELSEELGIKHDHPHRADSDAEVTAEILLKILAKFQELPVVSLQSLQKLSASFISDIDEILEELVSLNLLRLDKKKDGRFEMAGSLALRKFDSPDIHPEEKDKQFSFQDYMDNTLNTLKEKFGYDIRNSQIQYMNDVYTSFSDNQHSLLEAGTGNGKTLGYLLPSIYYSLRKSVPVVVSTYTTQLQQQIMEGEVALLKTSSPLAFRAALLKGRKHYVSLRKFQAALHDQDDNYDVLLMKAQILIWLTETLTGDIDELNFPSGGAFLWERIHHEASEEKIQDEWEFHCFYNRARNLADSANIIVTNHALLLSDIAENSNALPSYSSMIIDEAHQFERAASRFFGERLSYNDFVFQANRLENEGLLKNMQKEAVQNGLTIQHYEKVKSILPLLIEDANVFFSALHSYGAKKAGQGQSNKVNYRYQLLKEKNRHWQGIIEAGSRVKFLLLDLVNLLKKDMHALYPEAKDMNGITKGEHKSYFQFIYIFKELYEKIDALFFQASSDEVTWIEAQARGAKNAVSVYSQPVDISNILADRFFSARKSVVLTSATLSVRGSFDYIIQSLGLNHFYPRTALYESPFSYKEQAKIFVPTDMPNINQVPQDIFISAIATHISSAAQAVGGRMLILFNSFDMLKKTNSLLKEDDSLSEFVLLAQGTGSGSRSKITKNFKQFPKAILLGTASFWEGVNFPGEELSSLMIVRLPFQPPDEPIAAARSEKIEKQGGNAFYQYSLPEAILRFRQGFGRLIRTKDDKGVLFILDRRISTTRYGKHFIQSLPQADYYERPMGELEEIAKRWLADH